MNYSDTPTQENSNLDSSENSPGNTTYLTNEQVINYYNLRSQEELFLTESFIDYGTKYDTTKNFITRKQTTSLLNSPYFINSIIEGVSNEKNNIENPYVALGYLYLNSLPIATLREKFKSYQEGLTTELNYLFATFNKVSSIHKLPYLFILKYGSIWHRYKKNKETNIDILDNVWKDFDYKNAYDPISDNTGKSYTFTDYNGNSQTIKQFEQFTDQVVQNVGDPAFLGGDLLVNLEIESTRVQNGFYPKVINDVYYFFTKKDIFNTYSSSEIQSAQTDKKLKIGSSVKTKIQVSKNNSDYLMNTWSQFFEVKNNNDFREFEKDKILLIPSFGQSKFNQTRFECFDNVGNHTQNITTNPSIYNGGVRSLWSASNFGYFSNDMLDKPSPNQYLKFINPETKNEQAFNLGNDTSFEYSSIEDLFGVFTKDMLDVFEKHFLNFCQTPNKNENIVGRGETTFEEFLTTPEIVEQFSVNGEIPTSEYPNIQKIFENQESLFNGPNQYDYNITIYEVMKSLLMVDKPVLNYYLNLGEYKVDSIKNLKT